VEGLEVHLAVGFFLMEGLDGPGDGGDRDGGVDARGLGHQQQVQGVMGGSGTQLGQTGDALTDLAERDLLRPVIDRTFPLAVPLTPSSTSRPGGPAARWSSPSDRASAPAQVAAWRWLVHSVTARGSRTTTAVARGRRAA
jgi:hypothetical protein